MKIFSEVRSQGFFLLTSEVKHERAKGCLLYKKINQGTAMVRGRSAIYHFFPNEPVIDVQELETPIGIMFWGVQNDRTIRVVAHSEILPRHKPGEFYPVADYCLCAPQTLVP